MLDGFSTTQSHSAKARDACHTRQRWGETLTSVCPFPVFGPCCTQIHHHSVDLLLYISRPVLFPPSLPLRSLLFLFCETLVLKHGVRSRIQSHNRTNCFSSLTRTHTQTHKHTHTRGFTVNLNPLWLRHPPVGVFSIRLWPHHRHGTRCKETEQRKETQTGEGLSLCVCGQDLVCQIVTKGHLHWPLWHIQYSTAHAPLTVTGHGSRPPLWKRLKSCYHSARIHMCVSRSVGDK